MNRLFLSLLALAASAQDYFPLQVGNQWGYRTTGTRSGGNFRLEVTRQVEAGGASYFEVAGFDGGPHWLRYTSEGTLVAYDPATGAERIWYAFQTPEGGAYDTGIPYCCGRAMLVSRSAKYDGPLGQLANGLEIVYPGVFQDGVTWEQFLPGIGLVSRIEHTGGPSYERHDLVYASLRGHDVFSAPELSFSMTLDSARYKPGDPIHARLAAVARQPEPLVLTFPTSQRFDLTIRDGAGTVKYRWSDGQAFAPVVSQERVRGEKLWQIVLRPPPLPPGAYSLEAVLSGHAWRAVAAISIGGD